MVFLFFLIKTSEQKSLLFFFKNFFVRAPSETPASKEVEAGSLGLLAKGLAGHSGCGHPVYVAAPC